MNSISSFADIYPALQPYTLAITNVHKAYTLERMHQLMTALGNPQNNLKIIHVAGTSGKTSTSYYIAAMLQQAGLSAGLTVSPHLDEINERLQIKLTPLPEPEFCLMLSKFLLILHGLEVKPTFFELMIAFAYWYFAQQKLDYAVVEVGLGGLLDSTNVCSREDKVCVITDIGLDHTQILGTDLTAITAQKAGILQAHNAAICFKQSPEVDNVIRQKIKAVNGSLHAFDYQELSVTSLPAFQQRNWQLASHVYKYVQQRDRLPELTSEDWQHTRETYIPGRMEIIQSSVKTIILDGAHNPQKMQTLLASVAALYPNKAFTALVAVKASKDVPATLEPIINSAAYIVASEFSSGYGTAQLSAQAVNIAKLADKKINAQANPLAALTEALSRPESMLLVTGSLYFVQQIKKLLKDI